MLGLFLFFCAALTFFDRERSFKAFGSFPLLALAALFFALLLRAGLMRGCICSLLRLRRRSRFAFFLLLLRLLPALAGAEILFMLLHLLAALRGTLCLDRKLFRKRSVSLCVILGKFFGDRQKTCRG